MMRKTLFYEKRYPIIMKLIISFVVVLISGVDSLDGLGETRPFLSELDVLHNQVDTHL